MNKLMAQKLFSLVLVGSVATTLSCVDQRPARNGVFNENQYVRKSFLIRDGGGDPNVTDPGWMLKATVTQVSTPNPLGDLLIFPGLENGGALVRFRVTEDKLEMINEREINPAKSPSRTEEVVNAWSATNVDIKYRVNLDGETTNFLEENQELDWQQRQWVKLKLAKNDMSDLAPFGAAANDLLNKCVDLANVSATLVPDTFYTDEPNNYMQWVVEFTLPLKWDDQNCVTAYGPMGLAAERLGRGNVTFRLMYSMVRATPIDPKSGYKTMEVPEKDPIRHKYGWFETISISRDNDSGQLASRQLVNRFDPDKPINWYFAPGFPDQYKEVFTGKDGIMDQTNALLTNAGVKAQLSFQNFDAGLKDGQKPRQVGDIRYSFLVWISDQDVQSYWAGLTPSVNDPRTGESISSTVWLNDFAIKDYYVQRIDAYLQTVGASLDVNSSGEWIDGKPNCMDGDTMEIVKSEVAKNHNGNSTLYQKMQQYLQKPSQTYGNLGPQDFVATQDKDFFNAYYALLPYYVFADPDANPFVIREGGGGVYGADSVWQKLQKETDFQTTAAKIDQGVSPVAVVSGAVGVKETTDFLNTFRDLTSAHRDYIYAKNMSLTGMRADAADAFSFETVMARDARHCVNGKWETKQEWIDGLIKTYWSQVIWHEFGHAMGLTHNFMASLDKNNFPPDKAHPGKVGLYASSVMEYNAAPDRVFWSPGWAPYDEGALSFVYGNTAPTADKPSSSISGQMSPTSPWKDPKGFDPKTGLETQFLFCNEFHMKYSPFCKQGDLGTTPSEIIANAIDAYEWQYQWRNFRKYRKFWDNSAYANTPAGFITDMRRFLSLWAFDWSSGELADTLRRIGITNPDQNGSNLEYYTQLTNKFNKEASAANQMVAAFHKAIMQQSSGERPFATIYDKFYGDTTQQGIILDKLFAMQGWVGLWPTDNYDPNQAGSYIASYTGVGDSSYQYVSEDAVVSMIGGQYDVYPYFVPLAVAQFAQDTHSPSFSGRYEIRDWIGGKVFTRLQDFLDFFRDLAAQNAVCTSFDTCTYDPRPLSDTHNEFLGPDKRTWIWAYVPDRNQWVVAQKERNIATYIIVRNYTDDVINQQDDGAFPGSAYAKLLPMKFFLDSFNQYN